MVSHNPILRKRLTAERLAEAIHKAVSDQPMRQRAADLGPKIRAEAEIANAVVKTIEATRHESLGLRRVGWILFNMGIAEYWIVDYLGLGGRRCIGSPQQPTVTVGELVRSHIAVGWVDARKPSIFAAQG